MPPFQGIDTSQLLQTAMRVRVMNQNLIANNIANVDTPNYNPVSLDFQRTLRQALAGRGRISLRRTNPRHLERTLDLPKFEHVAISAKNDYNKVDLDHEMTRLSDNTGQYTTYGSLLVKRFRTIKDMLANTT